MKKLPKIYQNTITKKINNNKKVCYLNEKIKNENNNIQETLDEIFNGLGYSYNIPVEIVTKDNKYTTSILTKTKEHIITIDNDIILLKNILNIKKVQ